MEAIEQQVLGLLEQIRAFRRSENYPGAWEQLQLAQGICPKGRYDLQGHLEAMAGQLHRDQGNLNKATEQYKTALEYYRKVKDQLREAHVLRHLATIEEQRGQLNVARNYFQGCRDIYESQVETSKMDLANFYRAYALFLEKDQATRSIIHEYWTKARDIYLEYGIDDGVKECESHLSA